MTYPQRPTLGRNTLANKHPNIRFPGDPPKPIRPKQRLATGTHQKWAIRAHLARHALLARTYDEPKHLDLMVVFNCCAIMNKVRVTDLGGVSAAAKTNPEEVTAMETLLRGLTAFNTLKARFKRVNKWTPSGDEYVAIDAAVQLADRYMENMTEDEFVMGMSSVVQRARKLDH